MRRTASPLSLFLLGAGVFLLVLAPLLVWYVQPQAKRTPIDTDTTTVFTGTGSYFDTGKVETLTGKEITITRQVRGDVADSLESGNAVWDVSTSVDHAETLPASDPRDALQWTMERWVTDRYTNEPVHCCEESPTFDGEAYLKFPFDVEKRAYRWWDGTLGGVVRLEYAGGRKVQGYGGYLFKGTVEPTRTGVRQVPGVLVDRPKTPQILAEEWYSNSGIELVVDQRTGRIINAAIGPKKTLRAPGSSKDAVTLLESKRVEFTEETQKTQVELASADSRRLALLGGTLPAGAVALGLVLTLVGTVLVVRGRRSEPEAPNTHMMTNSPT
ncbi:MULTISPECIES: DUF3068 domain-containing protein [unclassified Streptomyces]|uniref:DUF3068 domain-containing protein n=1 Tax=unclassified Streptomyces TaxID=2593676 RepID=UPI000823E8A8|nr:MULTISPECIES: DUF3068 domain-containing protein [unclassified Streptomyces]MYT95734.1 DUF3068 domain-containing protein [Streptomyces sp. SID8350]SCK53322.1 Protein of unknown function [Streptomyces sp. AmelKG-D3]